ncbi:MAG TPA: hypothetical protein DHW20_01325 [Gemmatimonadetes bacterium]|jgi:hypothetical protein|nr:hypothetical protein [Gemmatimonadota bacterium]
MQAFLGSGQPLELTRLMLLNTQETRFDRKKTKDIVAVIGSAVLVPMSVFIGMACSLHTS